MVEVIIDSIRVSLMSQHRVVVLKDINAERYLTIWIGPCEAEAINIRLQNVPSPRPLTHDLLQTVITELGGKVVHILISAMREDIYYARIVLEVAGEQTEIDARHSDAIALAVRCGVPIFVADMVMDKLAAPPDEDVEHELDTSATDDSESDTVDESRLSAFADFLDTLDMDELDDDE